MKRIVSFLILSVLSVMIFTLPASEASIAVSHDPLPVWSILLYLVVVSVTGAAGFLMRRENR